MSWIDEMSGPGSLRLRCRAIGFGGLLLTTTAVGTYLVVLLAPSKAETASLVAILAASLVLVAAAAEFARRRLDAPILRLVAQQADTRERGGEVRQADSLAAYRAIVSIPAQMQKAIFYGCLLWLVFVPPAMWLLGHEAWLTMSRVQSLAVVSVATSLLVGTLVFHWAKQSLTEARVSIAKSLAEREFDDDLLDASRALIGKSLLVAVTVPVLACMLLIADVTSEITHDRAETRAAGWASLAVDSVAAGSPTATIAARIAEALPDEKFWPMPVSLFELRSDRIDPTLAVGEASREFFAALEESLASVASFGTIRPTGRPHEVGAYRRLENGSTVVAMVKRSDFGPQRAGLEWIMGLIGLTLCGAGVGVARLTSREFMRSAENLEQAASRIVAGDLGPGLPCETEGMLGGVGRELDRIRQAMRATHARISSVIEGVDRVAAEISATSGEMGLSSTSQLERVRQACIVIGEIDQRFGTAAQSTADLSGAIEESNSSVIELGAAGDELNETATVLSTKVDAVSGSLEQMVRSVQQVAGTSDRLAAASEETSSSMEEMASSMRAVDTSAETTANLSRDVVRIAELGQAKVVQTIAGMEAIREATEAAENVIRGLGARTNEIGGILDVIDDVADETSLLALNAAIIAAQAGDQGKAFSVVADEIKELADRVLASTKEIGSLIRAVQEESENAIGAIEAGSASVMSGVDLSAEAGRTLEEITVASRESGSRISEIVSSVREQTKAASHVAALMEKVRESAEEIGSAGTEQSRGNEVVYESALTMREVAQQVRRTTEDQARDFGRIRENVDGMRDGVERISGSLSLQSGACAQVKEVLDGISERSLESDAAVEKMQGAANELAAFSAALREESERFGVRESTNE